MRLGVYSMRDAWVLLQCRQLCDSDRVICQQTVAVVSIPGFSKAVEDSKHLLACVIVQSRVFVCLFCVNFACF